MPELKPCPFCGGVAVVVKVDGTNFYQVVCIKCPVMFGRWWFSKKRDAVNAWNRRAGDD